MRSEVFSHFFLENVTVFFFTLLVLRTVDTIHCTAIINFVSETYFPSI